MPPPTRCSISCRAILDRETIHIRDLHADPLLRDGTAIGVLSAGAQEPGGFNDSQVELFQTFAEQAVIAITSAETYRQLRARTEALAQRNSAFGERIAQQAAIIDVLKAMSSSPGDTRPVFDLIARRASELCESRCGLWEIRDGQMHVVTAYGLEPEVLAGFQRHFARSPDRSVIAGRAILEKRVVHIRHVTADATVGPGARGLGENAVVGMPLLLEGTALEAIALNGNHPGGFSDSQVALLQTFAEQAIIAMENARTVRQLREALDEQTATSEVRAVNSSLELETVLSTIISRAVQLSRSDEERD